MGRDSHGTVPRRISIRRLLPRQEECSADVLRKIGMSGDRIATLIAKGATKNGNAG